MHGSSVLDDCAGLRVYCVTEVWEVSAIWLPTFMPLSEKVFCGADGLPEKSVVCSVPVLSPENVMIAFLPVKVAVKPPLQVSCTVVNSTVLLLLAIPGGLLVLKVTTVFVVASV